MAHDYIGALTKEPEDAEQSGVKGMKWGVRRSREERAAASKKSEKAAPAPEKKTGGSNIQDHVESSSDRYSRLAAQAKAGEAHTMTEQDLKFFNARTEALSKVAKLNEEKPGWLAETTKKVILNTAEKQMQSVSDAVADKYIGAPIKDAIKGTTK